MEWLLLLMKEMMERSMLDIGLRNHHLNRRSGSPLKLPKRLVLDSLLRFCLDRVMNLGIRRILCPVLEALLVLLLAFLIFFQKPAHLQRSVDRLVQEAFRLRYLGLCTISSILPYIYYQVFVVICQQEVSYGSY